MNTDELLEQLITKHNFVVKVTIDPDDNLCVMVEFAGRKQAYYRVVVDEENEVYGICYWSSLMQNVNETTGESEGFEEFLPLQASAIRTYIICDIFRQCRWLDLPYDIIRYFSLNGEKCEFINLLTVPMDDNERDNEKLLEEYMSGILNGIFDANKINEVLEQRGLLHTTNILRSALL